MFKDPSADSCRVSLCPCGKLLPSVLKGQRGVPVSGIKFEGVNHAFVAVPHSTDAIGKETLIIWRDQHAETHVDDFNVVRRAVRHHPIERAQNGRKRSGQLKV